MLLRQKSRIFPLRIMVAAVFVGMLCHVTHADDQTADSDAALFARVIAPALETSCLRCHNASKARGGLSLADAAAFAKGGENGPVVVPKNLDESRLFEVVEGEEPEMPPDDDALTPEAVAAIRSWIESGALWPEGLVLADKSKKKQAPHWAFQPIRKVEPPAVAEAVKSWVRNPIDRFVAAKHAELGFRAAPEADRRTLARRLYFDLTGLPPMPEEIRAFVDDTAPDAYEEFVDRLLDSPAYGERWARHWLDIVHYGETHGYDKDKPRPNAWPYRDYVIDSLNADKPYGQFVREQIAGDAIEPQSPSAVKALGFLSAGPWDFIGHAEVSEAKTDGKIARHTDRDDMIGNAVGALMSVTIQCAQCHDHKFDPFLQKDYYALQATVAAVDRAERPFFADSDSQARFENARREKLALVRNIESAETKIAAIAGPELTNRRQAIETARAASKPAEHPQYGYHSAIEPKDDAEKWVRFEFDSPVEVRRIDLFPAFDNFAGIGAGFGFPVRYRIMGESGGAVTKLVDRTGEDQKRPGIEPLKFEMEPGQSVKSVTISATKLSPRQNDFIFALAEVAIIDAFGKNVAATARVSSYDTIEAMPRWGIRNLTDGVAPIKIDRAGDPNHSPEALEADLQKWLATVVPAELSKELADSKSRLAEQESILSSLKPAGSVFAATVHTGTGTFTGTGASGGKPRSIRILPRGDVNNPQAEVAPGGIESLGFGADLFAFPDLQDESDRRVALARWVTHRENPLIWRSIVNRVWQYHFGRGIVDPPGDFGRMGGTPSHPELLDWLASEFRDGGESLKSLHRTIVTSATYRQVSSGPDEFAAKDGSNVYLWRQNRRKLEAEAIRDSMLAVSGQLDRSMGGPPFQDFVIERPEHSPHYRYDLADPKDPATFRRSIYRLIVRSQPQPFLTAMDCADPSIRVDRRNESLSASAALAQWNHASVLAFGEAFGKRMEKHPGTLAERIAWGFETAMGRPPHPDELTGLTGYATKYGTARAARLMFNLNEFTFVD
jgi:mono/diheme cytochrome c family protein